MAHYAYLNDENIVTSLFVGRDENDPLPEGFASWEDYYGAKRCSYNTQAGKHLKGGVPFRKNYPSVGWSYDPARDAFIDPKPFPSCLVVKKGEKILFRSSATIPIPVSEKAMIADPFSTFKSMVIFPSFGIASMAFKRILKKHVRIDETSK